MITNIDSKELVVQLKIGDNITFNLALTSYLEIFNLQ